VSVEVKHLSSYPRLSLLVTLVVIMLVGGNMKELKGEWVDKGKSNFSDKHKGKLTYNGDKRPRIKFYCNGDAVNLLDILKALGFSPN